MELFLLLCHRSTINFLLDTRVGMVVDVDVCSNFLIALFVEQRHSTSPSSQESVPVVEYLKSQSLLRQVQCEKAVEEAGVQEGSGV